MDELQSLFLAPREFGSVETESKFAGKADSLLVFSKKKKLIFKQINSVK